MTFRLLCLLEPRGYKPGDPEPKGYLEWHEWARVQQRAGLRQTQCPRCEKWLFPQSRGKRHECKGRP